MLSRLRSQAVRTLGARGYHALKRRPQLLSRKPPDKQILLLLAESQKQHQRGIIMAARLLRSILKIRYFVLGGTLSGGVHMASRFEEWKKNLPDFEWIKDAVPKNENLKKIRDTLISAKDRGGEAVTVGLASFIQWLDAVNFVPPSSAKDKIGSGTVAAVGLFANGDENKTPKHKTEQERINNLQNDLINLQIKYQRELEKLEKENKELRREIILVRQKRESVTAARRQIKPSLIDIYSGVLDELSGCGFNVQDSLPRIVVVGDQSAGKTSVLEMIAQARIFPRGAGEMMTRSPVKVTLSEAADHTAKFNDSNREYDLTKESELVELRREIEHRMQRNVADGKTVSTDVISLSVKGPGLQRMVLVDLPGIISTSTAEMAAGTKESIREMTEFYMNNPNAIILCIQDGSVDPERSIVTDLVSRSDPDGKRTIFVLTKVDLAEINMANPNRIKKILDGRLFPMKALGYFAVVTGKGGKDDKIEDIRRYEEEFFLNSRLCRDGVLSASQCTTQNLSFSVSDCFWRMVKNNIKQHSDSFKAQRFNLEAEWKNSFPRLRALDRDELFERARSELLDEVVYLSQLAPREWELILQRHLWESVSSHVFDSIYLPAAQAKDHAGFNTVAEIRLKLWAENILPQKSVEAGWCALKEVLQLLMEKDKLSKNYDKLFDKLNDRVFQELVDRHTWEDKSIETLRLIQLNTLEDRLITDKHQWDSSVKFMEKILLERFEKAKDNLSEFVGPGFYEQWFFWRRRTSDQTIRVAIKNELEAMFTGSSEMFFTHGPALTQNELTIVRRNLQSKGYKTVDFRQIKDVWDPVYQYHFLKRAVEQARDRSRLFYEYQKGKDNEASQCSDIVFFWKVHRMIQTTSSVLRQQLMNRETKKLEKEVKDIFEDIGQDVQLKKELLTGRRVELAEDLKRVRAVQEKLEEFIEALNKEK
ncbi:dynamin-like 120 kDa protein, mitochondrial [Varroa jacobsoni]|uniref:dynamin-like 120 kDa protein, mitochondrial n=1 Tax=Varroa jacobsoni TaxID=62625 RepID=UPI000BF52AD2|nr:dynamin-like 120 kDa protein, mitochondrial [Varroa jacobsoni]